MTAGTINIGDSNSGTITISLPITRAAATNMNLATAATAGVSPTASGSDLNLSGGTLSISSGSDLKINIAGTTVNTQYNQLNVVSPLNLSGIDLALSGAFVSSPANVFTIVSATSVTGTFNGLAENAVVSFNGRALRVNYTATTVTLTDIGVANNPPVAQDDDITTDEDSPVTFNVLDDNGHGPDSDAEGNLDPSLTVNLTSPDLGDLTDNGNGSFTYDPDGLFESLADGEFTTQTFTYQIEDIFGETATATVDIKITGENDAPTAIGTLSDVTVNQNAANSVISLTGLFDDVDANDTLTITAVSSSDGLVTAGVSGNSLTLDYQANQSGTATITVTATDGSGASVNLTFDVAVLSPNHLANDIIQLIRQWQSDSKINAGVANSMIVKVVNSLKSYEKGNLAAAENQLSALKNEISAKVKPSSLTLEDATLAFSLIDELFDSMTP